MTKFILLTFNRLPNKWIVLLSWCRASEDWLFSRLLPRFSTGLTSDDEAALRCLDSLNSVSDVHAAKGDGAAWRDATYPVVGDLFVIDWNKKSKVYVHRFSLNLALKNSEIHREIRISCRLWMSGVKLGRVRSKFQFLGGLLKQVTSPSFKRDFRKGFHAMGSMRASFESLENFTAHLKWINETENQWAIRQSWLQKYDIKTWPFFCVS